MNGTAELLWVKSALLPLSFRGFLSLPSCAKLGEEGREVDFSWQQGRWVLGWNVGGAGASLTCCSPHTGQQSPQLCGHTAQTLPIPSQSRVCGAALVAVQEGVFVVGDCWGQWAQLRAELSEMQQHRLGCCELTSGCSLSTQGPGSSLLLVGPLRTGRTKESEARPLAELALQCHWSQLPWLQGPPAPVGDGGCPEPWGLLAPYKGGEMGLILSAM